MIEIILPTMWYNKRIFDMLDEYINNINIKTIHLIDNSNEFYKYYPSIPSKKLKLYSQESNIFVNPSWNLGISQCLDDSIICIVNDDITFDTNIFEWILNHTEEFNILGMDAENYNNLNLKWNPKINKTPHHTYGWGCMIFLKKEIWIPIPNDLKIFYGDTWMFHNIPVECKKLSGFPIESNMGSTSSSSFVNPIHIKDIEAWDKLSIKESLNWF
jgi:hypothetical protein